MAEQAASSVKRYALLSHRDWKARRYYSDRATL